jgi:hypothetical protein
MARPNTQTAHPEGVFVLGAGGAWFRPPNAERVDLTKRKQLRRLLGELVRYRRSDPGSPVSTSTLVSVGWPDEKLGHDDATNRLRVALSTLRKLGLGEIVKTRAGGYLLDPSVPLHFADE